MSIAGRGGTFGGGAPSKGTPSFTETIIAAMHRIAHIDAIK
jgi:hypothetical protein